MSLDDDSQWKEILDKLCLNGKQNKINYQEFLAAAITQEKLMTDENIKIAFDLFDTNGDGKIDETDFNNLISKTSMDSVEHTLKFTKTNSGKAPKVEEKKEDNKW